MERFYTLYFYHSYFRHLFQSAQNRECIPFEQIGMLQYQTSNGSAGHDVAGTSLVSELPLPADINRACSSPTSSSSNENTELLRQMLHTLSTIRQELPSLPRSGDEGIPRRDSLVASEWREVSIVLDRSFFFFFLIAIFCSLVWLFPRPNAS